MRLIVSGLRTLRRDSILTTTLIIYSQAVSTHICDTWDESSDSARMSSVTFSERTAQPVTRPHRYANNRRSFCKSVIFILCKIPLFPDLIYSNLGFVNCSYSSSFTAVFPFSVLVSVDIYNNSSCQFPHQHSKYKVYSSSQFKSLQSY